MQRLRSSSVSRALLSGAVAAAALAAGGVSQAGPPQPDLVITQFGLKSWGGCTPAKPVFTFQVTVRNQGKASWSATGPEATVLVSDLHPGVGQNWGSGVGFAPLAPGQSTTISVPISYYSGNPSHMWKAAPHPFQAVVNSNHAIVESNYANNVAPGPATWNGQKVIMVGDPTGCPKK